jgi:hypothetical protein
MTAAHLFVPIMCETAFVEIIMRAGVVDLEHFIGFYTLP